MPVATVTCVMCKKQVTRRSTISLAAIGASSGKERACRKHMGVSEAIHALQDIRFLKHQAREIHRQAQSNVLAMITRVFCTLENRDPDVIYSAFRFLGVQEGDLQLVQKKVAERGGPFMPTTKAQQIFDSVLGVTLEEMRRIMHGSIRKR